MLKKILLALAIVGALGATFSNDAQAGGYVVRRPVLRAIIEANRNAPVYVAPTPTWGYRFTPYSNQWSFRPDTGWGFYQQGGWGWGFGY